MELDLTRNDAPKELINKVTEQLGYPDILINNADILRIMISLR